jgi:hypothetical protein
MMRKGFLLSIAAFGGISGSAVAADLSYPTTLPPSDSPVYSPAPMVVGHLEGGLGALFFDIESLGDFLEDTGTFGLASAFGRANVPLFGGTWNFEAEIGGFAVFEDGDTASTLEGIGHLWGRMPTASAGVFAGATAFAGTGIGTVGLEGEAYFGNVTLGAQGSYNWSEDFDELWGLRGYADWYVNPDLRLGGDVQFWTVESVDIWQFAGDVEKRFTGTPISVGGTVSYITADGEDAWTAMANARIFMDQQGMTLQQHDREVPFDFAIGTAVLSDQRLKTDIVQVGMLGDDIPLYRFRYLWSDEVFVGVMAQDLLALRPDALVVGSDGFYRVDYATLGTRMMHWGEWQAVNGQSSGAYPGVEPHG